MSVERDIELDQASDYTFQVQWKSGGVGVDTTGWSARLEGKRHIDDTEAPVDLRLGTGIVAINAALSSYQVTFRGADYEEADWRTLIYSMVLWEGPANAPTAMKTLLEGEIHLTPTVARPV